jgi:peptidyl-Lys metalloendopeptidase
MKERLLKAAFLGGIVFVPTIAFADGHLVATLSVAPESQKEGSKVVVTIRNDGDQATAIYSYATPLKLLNGRRLPRKSFTVQTEGSPTGEEASYTGIWMTPTHFNDEQFVTIEPGQSISASYDLSNDYDVKAGNTYKVTYTLDLSARPTDRSRHLTKTSLKFNDQESVVSNTVTINVTDQSLKARKPNIAVADTTSSPDFTSAQYDTLSTAWTNANTIAENVMDAYQDGLPPLSVASSYTVGGSTYTWWFGTYGGQDPNAMPPNTDSLITGTLYDGIANRLNAEQALYPIIFVDGCPAGTDPNTAAIAETGSVVQLGEYQIAICNEFWNLPAMSSLTSASSQASTLIHEISHFKDQPQDAAIGGWLYPTVDVSFGSYTLSGAHNLAVTNRAQAVTNASNYEYFEVNIPAH